MLALELSGHDSAPAARQHAMLHALREALEAATRALPPGSWQVRDTDQGAQVTFLATPTHACLAALTLMRAVAQTPSVLAPQALRMGLHFGTVLPSADTADRTRYVGEAVKTASQLMEAATAGQALASRAFFDAIAHVDHGMDRLFGPVEQRQLASGRPMECHPLAADSPAYDALDAAVRAAAQTASASASDTPGLAQATEFVRNWFAPLNVMLAIGSFVVSMVGKFTDQARGTQAIAMALMVLALSMLLLRLLRQLPAGQRWSARAPAFVRTLASWPCWVRGWRWRPRRGRCAGKPPPMAQAWWPPSLRQLTRPLSRRLPCSLNCRPVHPRRR